MLAQALPPIAGLATCSSVGGIFAHSEAHIVNDESTAPELFTGSARQFTAGGSDAKPSLLELEEAIDMVVARGVHSVQPSVIAISNLTELGARLSAIEVTAYAELAKSRGMKLFMYGARFANAVVSGDESPAGLTWRAGVDALSFGATKNGAMAAEALIFFNPRKDAQFHRKRGGHLWSKLVLAAQFAAYLENDLWRASDRQMTGWLGSARRRLIKKCIHIGGRRWQRVVHCHGARHCKRARTTWAHFTRGRRYLRGIA